MPISPAMANVIGFGLDIAINIVVLAEAFGGIANKPVAKIGAGGQGLQGAPAFPDDATPGGVVPTIDLYDIRGAHVARNKATTDPSISDGAEVAIEFQEFPGGGDITKSP